MPNLSIPEATYRQLVTRAAAQNIAVDVLAERLLADPVPAPSAADRMLDTAYHAACAADMSPVPTLDEVRAVTAKLTGSFAAELIAERDER